MMRWMGMSLVIAYSALIGGFSADASDHLPAKSLTPSGTSVSVRDARSCSSADLLGNWELITFDSSYQFKNQHAPYLYPHQMFQYSRQGRAKSLHSLRPIVGQPDSLFAPVPVEILYQVKKNGRVSLTAPGHAEPVETWRCEVVTQSRPISEQNNARERGDLIMTLIGSEGQSLFVRHLRKRAA